MLGLWSMAAQLRACHCRACLRATTNTAARRVTTGTTGTTGTTSNPRRRKALASDVFTACYTAIMATAAVLDAGRKHRRRRELDGKIAEARGSLAGLFEDSAARDLAKLIASPYPDIPYSRPRERLDVLNDICKLQPDFLRNLGQKRKDRLRTLQQLRKMLGLRWNPELPDTRKSTLTRCEEIIIADEKQVGPSRREPKTETHMEKITDMITGLVDRLMAEAWWTTEVEAPRSHPSLNSPDSAATMIRMLRSDGYPSYDHPDLDPGGAIEQRARLDEVNLKIMEEWAPPFRERHVAKICYNLLVCGVPPGIENYNLLILGFSLLGEHNLSQAVVDSFLFMSHMKPTEATYLCLLHHYRLKGDVVGFQGLLRRMFGHDPRGIGLMRRTADYVARNPELQDWASTEDVAVVNGHYVQRAPLTQNVAEAILEGLIDFGMLREGAKLVAVFLREQWAISGDLLWRLSHSCLTLLDTAAAKMFIRGLLDNIDQASLMLLGPEPPSPALVRQLRHVLNLCQTASLPEDGGVHHGGFHSGDLIRETEKANINHLATAIWIRETWHHSSMMSWWLRRVMQTLSEDTPLIKRLNSALYVLDLAAKRPGQKLDKAEHIQRVAKVDWLVTQTVVSEYKIRNAENVISNVLAKQTPRQLRTRSHFNPSVPIEKRIDLALPYGIPGTLEHDAATCFDLSKEIDFQLKLALIRGLPETYARGLMQEQSDSGDVSLGRILAYFNHYLAGLKIELAKEAELAKPDPFARLLQNLPKPNISFWRSAPPPAAAEAAAAASSGHGGW
ncbi:hypothetical protein C8A00DRAFT_44855 [Chaetomidium leptoderma]|uniref:Pentatricopeptide repeat domain-containing protein n=1 Tax=Chaetomidium leptoderma TaxID=669021 RepID=A0AAN6VI91_9PEZI|nr:hypothetical protein C8A00DRAFT_44855 [Chaetomidium leptoderma]